MITAIDDFIYLFLIYLFIYFFYRLSILQFPSGESHAEYTSPVLRHCPDLSTVFASVSLALIFED